MLQETDFLGLVNNLVATSGLCAVRVLLILLPKRPVNGQTRSLRAHVYLFIYLFFQTFPESRDPRGPSVVPPLLEEETEDEEKSEDKKESEDREETENEEESEDDEETEDEEEGDVIGPYEVKLIQLSVPQTTMRNYFALMTIWVQNIIKCCIK